MSAFSDVTAAIVTALSALAGGHVTRGYAWPMPEAVDESIVVRPISALAERNAIGSGPVDWRTTVMVELRARYTPDSESADQAIDALLAAVYAALATVTATGLQDVIPATSLQWDYSAADANVVAVSFTVDVLHRTESATLSAWT